MAHDQQPFIIYPSILVERTQPTTTIMNTSGSLGSNASSRAASPTSSPTTPPSSPLIQRKASKLRSPSKIKNEVRNRTPNPSEWIVVGAPRRGLTPTTSPTAMSLAQPLDFNNEEEFHSLPSLQLSKSGSLSAGSAEDPFKQDVEVAIR